MRSRRRGGIRSGSGGVFPSDLTPAFCPSAVRKAYVGPHERQEVGTIGPSPADLRHVQELVGHQEPLRARPGALRHTLAQPHCRERRLDHVRGLEMLPCSAGKGTMAARGRRSRWLATAAGCRILCACRAGGAELRRVPRHRDGAVPGASNIALPGASTARRHSGTTGVSPELDPEGRAVKRCPTLVPK